MIGHTWEIMNGIHKSAFEFLIWDATGRQDIWNLDLTEKSGPKMKLSDCIRITKGGN